MNDKLAVSNLNIYYQKRQTVFKEPPTYNVQTTDLHPPQFTAILKFDGITKTGVGPSKNEAKRLAAASMLGYLNNKNSTPASSLQSKVNNHKSPLRSISQPREQFDKEKLDIYLDKYLPNREKNSTVFNKKFVLNIANNLTEQYGNIDAGFRTDASPKSKLLSEILARKNELNVISAFVKIMEEMELEYYSEFVETRKGNGFTVMVKINFNLFTVYGEGESPEKAVEACLTNAIELLAIFNS